MPDLSAADCEAATLLLDAGRDAEALRFVEPLAAANAAAELLHAHILAAGGRWTEALPIYERIARAADAPTAPKLGLAESLHATGRIEDAIQILDSFVCARIRARPPRACVSRGPLTEAGRSDAAHGALATAQAGAPGDLRWKTFIEGRLLLLKNKAAEAAAGLGYRRPLPAEPCPRSAHRAIRRPAEAPGLFNTPRQGNLLG